VSESVVATTEGGEVVGGCWTVFGPCGGVVEVAVCCGHAASGEDTVGVSGLNGTSI